ncbi:MAG: hypothetical protein E3J73_04860 [Candidatus Bathyarchaeum sp.]|nr:MAG: hypothetical protein E3J73_04860 [Candidatus Bathyarchaeum sp.]
MKSTKVLSILGTRPQFIKSAPLIHMTKKDSDIDIQRRLKDKNNPFGDRKALGKILSIFKEFDPCPLKR